ncbi:MAG: A/G-specific adenine glycosylase [Myxococcota bacterium]
MPTPSTTCAASASEPSREDGRQEAEATAAARVAWVRRLTEWYRRHRRDLPWRRTRDPYAIWVSEIMLQQTRVDTVVPFYRRFLSRFPTVDALATAPLDDVLTHWQGLGYYRRARQLHAAAGQVVADHGGAFPRTADGLRRLAGIGPYTAGAIASIAFEAPAPLVDGNVARVLARQFGIDGDIKQGRTQRALWRQAGALVAHATSPGAFNQALMELGATVCTPRAPRCGDCPVADPCFARTHDAVARLPVVGKKKAPAVVSWVAAVVLHPRSQRVVLAQRQAEGLFGGLWEPPMVEANDPAAARAALERLGAPRATDLREVATVTHRLTHRRFEVTVVRGRTARAHRLSGRTPERYVALQWARPDERPLSTLARRVLGAAETEQEALF